VKWIGVTFSAPSPPQQHLSDCKIMSAIDQIIAQGLNIRPVEAFRRGRQHRRDTELYDRQIAEYDRQVAERAEAKVREEDSQAALADLLKISEEQKQRARQNQQSEADIDLRIQSVLQEPATSGPNVGTNIMERVGSIIASKSTEPTEEFPQGEQQHFQNRFQQMVARGAEGEKLKLRTQIAADQEVDNALADRQLQAMSVLIQNNPTLATEFLKGTFFPEKGATRKTSDLVNVLGLDGQPILQTTENAALAAEAGFPMAAVVAGPTTTINMTDRAKQTVFASWNEKLMKGQETLIGAETTMKYLEMAKIELDKGVISGWAADPRKKFHEFLTYIGFQESSDAVKNTNAYIASTAKLVGDVIRLFGAGTGLSDKDLEFAKVMAGGNISLTPESMRRILDINAIGQMMKFHHYNQVFKVKDNEGNLVYENLGLDEFYGPWTMPTWEFASGELARLSPEGMIVNLPKTRLDKLVDDGTIDRDLYDAMTPENQARLEHYLMGDSEATTVNEYIKRLRGTSETQSQGDQ
jgi:hypothetical protein